MAEELYNLMSVMFFSWIIFNVQYLATDVSQSDVSVKINFSYALCA